MHPADREKIAFITKYSTYEFNIMSFELCNTSATFQYLMNQIYKEIAYKYIVIYLDNTNIFLWIFEDYIQHLREVFIRIRKAKLKLNLEKYTFWMKRLPFLGHIIEAKGISPD